LILWGHNHHIPVKFQLKYKRRGNTPENKIKALKWIIMVKKKISIWGNPHLIKDHIKELRRFIREQKDLDPEFNEIINELIWELVDNKPQKKRFDDEGR
jgi:hypothetical protein